MDDIHFIQRGYEAFEEKLQGLGADIVRQAVVEKAAAEKVKTKAV